MAEKFARRILVRRADGKVGIAAVDAFTGEFLEDATGYEFLDQGENFPYDSTGKKSSKSEEDDKEEAEGEKWWELPSIEPDQELPEYDRREDENYGFIEKPRWMQFLGLLPGPFGMMGGVLNAGINANNIAAVNAARGDLGLGSLSLPQTVAGFMRGPNPDLGTVNINGAEVPVSMTGESKDGTPAFTPKQAVELNTPVEPNETEEALTETEAEVVNQVSEQITGLAGPELNPQQASQANRAIDRAITPGAGLANLLPNFGPRRPEPPEERVTQLIQEVVGTVLGPDHTVVAKSGQEGNRPQFGSPRHGTGRALDFQILDPNGNLLNDPQTLNRVAQGLASRGFTGIGIGRPGGYMGGRSIHADQAYEFGNLPRGTAHTWGGNTAALAGVEDVMREVAEGRQPPVPQPNPNRGQLAGTAQEGPTEGVVEATEQAVAEGPHGFFDQADRPSAAQHAIESIIANPEDRVQRAEEETRAMAFAIAGELGARTVQAIRQGDPAALERARQEIAAIATTMDNRANSTRFGGDMRQVLTPNQYNSLIEGNINTTAANFNSIGDFIVEALNDYNVGNLVSPVPGATHYRANFMNPAPGWENHSIGGTVQVGEHTFARVAIPGTSIAEFRAPTPIPQSNPLTGEQAPSSEPVQVADASGTVQTPGPSQVVTADQQAITQAPGTEQQAQEAPSIAQQTVQQTVAPLEAAPVDRDITRSPLEAPPEPLTAAPVDRDITRSPLGQVQVTGTGLNVNVPVEVVQMTEQEWSALTEATKTPAERSETGWGYSPTGVGMAPTSATTVAMSPAQAGTSGFVSTDPGGLLGEAMGAGGGKQSQAGLGLGYTPGTIGGTGIGTYGGSGAFSGSAAASMMSPGSSLGAGLGLGLGPPGTTAGQTAGYSLSMAPGSGYGHQGNAGIGMGVGGSAVGTMSSTAGMNAAQASFGGFSAGSLSGSASGFGSGYGAPSVETAGSFSNVSAGGGGWSTSTGFSSAPTSVSSASYGGSGIGAGSGMGGGFGGFSAGSIGGSASGAGAGYGAAGASGATGGFSGGATGGVSGGGGTAGGVSGGGGGATGHGGGVSAAGGSGAGTSGTGASTGPGAW